MLRNGYLKIGYQLWQQEKERRKGFSTVWIRTILIKNLYIRAIQGHSGNNAVDRTLQEYVLLPKGLTEYIYYVGNANELNSIIRNGLIPGGTSIKRGRQAVFFTAVNPTEDVYGTGKLHAILRNQGSRHTRILGNAFKIQYFGALWSSFKRKGLQFLQDTVIYTCSLLLTACTLHWKSGMYENSRGALPKGALNFENATNKNRNRNMVHKIRKAKKQDHRENHRAMRKVTGKLVTTSWITEYIEYLFLQSSRRIQYATKKSQKFDRKVREPQT